MPSQDNQFKLIVQNDLSPEEIKSLHSDGVTIYLITKRLMLSGTRTQPMKKGYFFVPYLMLELVQIQRLPIAKPLTMTTGISRQGCSIII